MQQNISQDDISEFITSPKVTCNNIFAQIRAMLVHRINSDTYYSLRKNFEKIEPFSAPKEYSTDAVSKVIYQSGATCDHDINFGKMDCKITNNHDIGLDIAPHEQPGIKVIFSQYLFRGILSVVQPDRFEFCKGRTNDGKFTVCFTTFNGNLALHWDVSSAYPIFPDCDEQN